MKLGNGKEITFVDELSERRYGRVVRAPEEVSMIADLARDLCGGDEAKAGRLLHRILFEMYDRTWGVSLHEGDPDLPLVETKMVCEYLRLAVESWGADDLRKLTERAVNLAVKRPHQILLYRSMVYGMGGAENVKAFEKALALAEGRLLPLDSEDVRIYQRVAGKSYWELDLEMLRRVFISNFLAWRVSMVKFEELKRKEIQRPEVLSKVSVFLTEVRVDLRRIARVVVAKKALPERELTKPPRIEIDTEKIIAIQIMMGETEEVNPEEDDFRIDMETALSFLD